MEILKKDTHIDFIGKRRIAFIISAIVLIVSIGALATRGLNFGVDFTGGSLVEVGYSESIDVGEVRTTLEKAGFSDATVQYFGTASDVLVRLPISESQQTAEISNNVMQALRAPYGERLVEGLQDGVQQCVSGDSTADCSVQMRRVEFVGPQVGEELTEKGTLAMLWALVGIMFYVGIRFLSWKFAVASVAALAHDVLITVGLFALFQFEFSLPVLAAVLAVIGYSLNDTIVVFDRIRENLRKMRRRSPNETLNASINQTLRRTLLTSLTTLLVVLTLLLIGGEVISGFATALLIGVLVGTYSSVFVASPIVFMLGVSHKDFIPVEKEGAELDALP
ncbi:MAG: protein translocase subunit SecF [Gammaproteobacteria bacterium]|nr:protein translocase subunit SecF [Gammaproteobacteria bacterium]